MARVLILVEVPSGLKHVIVYQPVFIIVTAIEDFLIQTLAMVGDSYHEVWYYGHCGYFLIVYNPHLKLDLPIYLRLVQAQRHDGVTAIVALSEVLKLYPDFNFNEFLGDGAHDNNPTYDLLEAWNIKAIIPLNKKSTGNFKYNPPIKVGDNGVPICIGEIPMVYDYYDKVRHRIKWRCPHVKGRIKYCYCIR